MERFFRSLSTLMSNQLRQAVRISLADLCEVFSCYQISNKSIDTDIKARRPVSSRVKRLAVELPFCLPFVIARSSSFTSILVTINLLFDPRWKKLLIA